MMRMKRLLLTILVMIGGLAAKAYNYPYLTLKSADGTLKSVPLTSLVLTFSNGQLVATTNDGAQTFELADLNSMHFSKTDETTEETKDPVANGLAFSSTTATAKMGESFDAPVLTNPYQLEVTWSSSNEAVATVDQTGAVTLVAAGTTVITATFAGSDDYVAGAVSYTLTVKKADPVANGLAFSSTTVTAKMGESFDAPVLTNPYQLEVTWSSSNEAVATVNQTGGVTLIAAGTTVITATFSGSDNYLAGSASYTLTVEKADPGSNALSFSSSTATAKMGEVFTEPALSNPYQLELTWSRSDEAVATVDQTGAVTLVAAGTTIIIATFAGSDDYVAGSANYTLTVEEPVMNTIPEMETSMGDITVYTLSGTLVGSYATMAQAKALLRSGVYIIKYEGKTIKISIKK